jgi:hypothetical protein
MASSQAIPAGTTDVESGIGRPALLDEGFFRRYRELLDAEDAAFDDLEHAYEDGDRHHFDVDLTTWQESLRRRMAFLDRTGLQLSM